MKTTEITAIYWEIEPPCGNAMDERARYPDEETARFMLEYRQRWEPERRWKLFRVETTRTEVQG